MTNTSATGGYLAPGAAPAPIYGAPLNDFLQAWIAGITSIDGTLVRPVLQAEPPNIPNAGTLWCAFRVTIEQFDTFPFVQHTDAGDLMQRHELIHVLCSFYDLGESGLAWQSAGVMRDGTAIAQNREPLLAQAMALRECRQPILLPSLFKERWQVRVDLPIILARQVDRLYPVLDLASAQFELDTDVGISRHITVTK